jgi:hypothetical protein
VLWDRGIRRHYVQTFAVSYRVCITRDHRLYGMDGDAPEGQRTFDRHYHAAESGSIANSNSIRPKPSRPRRLLGSGSLRRLKEGARRKLRRFRRRSFSPASAACRLFSIILARHHLPNPSRPRPFHTARRVETANASSRGEAGREDGAHEVGRWVPPRHLHSRPTTRKPNVCSLAHLRLILPPELFEGGYFICEQVHSALPEGGVVEVDAYFGH